jgi:hypothetical protein
MTLIEQNIISAVTIGLIIATMAYVKNSHLKALIYSLPIPITIALIATGGRVNITNIIGLLLLSLFLWSVWFLKERGVNIFTADIISALSYVLVGYFAVMFIKIPFYFGVLIYFIIWIIFIILYKNKRVAENIKQESKIKPEVKGVIVTGLAYILLSLKSFLSGIIVTFPFSGVFAVVEGKNMLETLASVFSRNSLAILAMFTTIYLLDKANLGIKISAGWIAYLIVLNIVTKFISFKKR